MFRSSVRVAALSVRRYATISASLKSVTLVAVESTASRIDDATSSSMLFNAARNPAT